MVRVIPVHNFLEHNVSPTEEPTAVCIAKPDDAQEYLLLSLPSHCIEVRDLTTNDLAYVTCFPTVDLATKVAYCPKGNYVATLETKVYRENPHMTNYVRIYVNWSAPDHQPMRARIAGRVTPSLNRPQNTLEMIELPLKSRPTSIACCTSTGNILVATGNTLIVHEFKIETQNLTKTKFIDFEARPWSLGLQFLPTHLYIVEDYILIGDSMRFVVVRLANSLYEDIDHLSSLTSTTSSNDKTTISTDFCSMDAIDKISITTSGSNEQDHQPANRPATDEQGNKKNYFDRNYNPRKFFDVSMKKIKKYCIDWNRLESDEKNEINALINAGLVDQKSQPFTVNFPTICQERVGPGHLVSPFVIDTPDTEVIIKTSSPDVGWSENFVVKHVLRLKISKYHSPSHQHQQNEGTNEFFTASVFRPLYLKALNNQPGKKSFLRSDRYKHLNGVTCLICTSQEGYLYHFNANDEENGNPACLTTYQFTAPLRHVALEYTVLHALTEAGLESYTLRLPHHVAKTSSQLYEAKRTCADINDPICLIGLRPFQGIRRLLNSDNFLALMAKTNNSWTIHSLRLPSPENVYYDIINAARNHRTTSPSTYRHLLEEANAMLRLSKDIAYSNDSITENNQKLEILFCQSCALLGDHFIRSELESERKLCIPYYKMSGLKPNEILSRKSAQGAPGLIIYLTDVLLNIKSGPEADALFTQKDIIEIISMESNDKVCRLIFESVILREYASEKLIKLLESTKYSESRCENSLLCLSLLYLQEEKSMLAREALKDISDKFLHDALLDYPYLLFEDSTSNSKNQIIFTFSEFSALLISFRNSILARILSELIEEEMITLQQVIQMFLAFLPCRVGKDSRDAAETMQIFLEMYLQTYFLNIQEKDEINYNIVLVEAFRILVRSYLGKLMQTKLSKFQENPVVREWHVEDDYLFESQRPKYLDLMPPFSKTHQPILRGPDHEEFDNFNNIDDTRNDKNIPLEVLKLQALLASAFLPNECIKDVEQFLEKEDIEDSLAFQTLCSRDTEVVTRMLLEKYPYALIQYAKDTYKKETEWKLLLDLLEDKISKMNSNHEWKTFFEQMMIEIVKYIAEILPFKSLQYILPKSDEETFQRYTEICSQIVHAEHVKSLLMETGRQLLSSLNL